MSREGQKQHLAVVEVVEAAEVVLGEVFPEFLLEADTARLPAQVKKVKTQIFNISLHKIQPIELTILS